MPKISVVIPTYNAAQYVGEAIESVLNQTFKDYEIVVVDDGSTDNTEELLQKYVDRIRYIKQKNGGEGAARNRGIREAHGEWVAFLDADDLWLPHKLKVQMEFVEQHPDVDFIYGDTSVFDSNRVLSKSVFSERQPHEGRIIKNLLRENCVPILSVIARKKCFEKSGLFKEGMKYCTDYEMWLRFAKYFKFGYVNEVVASCRKHEKGVSQNMEQMHKTHLNILNTTLKDMKIPYAAADRIRSFNYFKNGYLCFEKKNKDASKNFFLSILNNPFYLKSWVYLFLSMLPSEIIIFLKKIKKYWKSIYLKYF